MPPISHRCILSRKLSSRGFIQKFRGFEFMKPLVTDMVQSDPMKRPTMDEVVTRVSEIKSKPNTWKLRSRMARKYELWPVAAWWTVRIGIGPSATSLVAAGQRFSFSANVGSGNRCAVIA